MTQQLDWEVELGVVIGRRAAYLDSPADAALDQHESPHTRRMGGRGEQGGVLRLGPLLAAGDHQHLQVEHQCQ